MAQQSVNLRVSGLYSFPSHLSAVPAGALLKASNIVINRDSIAESRRGFKIYGNAMGVGSTNTAHQLLDYKSRLLRHWGTDSGKYLDYDSDGNGTFETFKVILFADLVNGSPNVSNITDDTDNNPGTSILEAGMEVSGTGIPANTTILSISDNMSVILSNNATTTATSSLTFVFKVEEVTQGLRIKGIEQNGNFYFTSSEGIKKIAVADASQLSTAYITNAGGIKALDVQGTTNATPGFLSPQSTVAYRIVWGIKDVNQNLILGSPSSREIVQNIDPSSSATVDLRITIPQKITPSYFYQIYRTAVFSYVSTFTFSGDTNSNTTITNIADTSSLSSGMSISGVGIPASTVISSISSLTSIEISNAATATNSGVTLTVSQVLNVDPGDEEGLVYENNPTTADLANGFLTVTDVTPDSFRGANLYTNANSGEGIAQANNPPPLAKDIAAFKNYTFYANTRTLQTLNVSLLSVANFVDGVSTFSISDGTVTNTYTFSSSEDISMKKVLISNAATPAQQVDETAKSLVRVINNQDNELVYAYYLSGITDVPGLILLEARQLNSDAFYLNVDDAATTGVEFSPNLLPAGSTVVSNDEVSPNRIYYSKEQQPESVPVLNYIDIGPKDKQILRILALRDSLVVLKEEGVYRLSGLVAPFSVFPFDFSTNIKATDSAVVLNNLIYVFTNQGITTVSDTNVAIISRPIEDKIISLLGSQYPNFNTATFGISYESDRAYYLFTVKNTSDVYATQCFRYNTFTQTWTSLDLSKRCGIVNFGDDKLYLGPTDINYIEQERKLFDRTDYADREYDLAVSSQGVSGTNISISTLENISIGDVGVQIQYLTMGQFNRLLSKLDKDAILADKNYVSTQTVEAGVNLSDALDLLIAKIRDDSGRQAVAGHTSDGTYSALIGTGSPSFFSLQTAFNNLIAVLNGDIGVGYKNYIVSSGTTTYEFYITGLVTGTLSVVASDPYPIIEGPITIYNHISTDLLFVPQFLGDVSITKHVSEGTFIFEDTNFTKGDVSYASDLSANYETITINANGNGTFGTGDYGLGVFGGDGSGVPFRTYIPKDKQRCRYINARFQHSIAREIFSLYGISLTFDPVSSRGYR